KVGNAILDLVEGTVIGSTSAITEERPPARIPALFRVATRSLARHVFEPSRRQRREPRRCVHWIGLGTLSSRAWQVAGVTWPVVAEIFAGAAGRPDHGKTVAL